MTRREEREAELRAMLLHEPGRRWVMDFFLEAYDDERLPRYDSPEEMIQAILAKEFPVRRE